MPKSSGLAIPGGRLRVSCKTTSLRVAAGIRDQYIVPLFATTSTHAALTSLVRMIAENSEQMHELLAGLAEASGHKSVAGILAKSKAPAPLLKLWQGYLKYLRNTKSLAPSSLKKTESSQRVWCTMLGANADAQLVTRADIVAARNELLTMPRNYFLRSDPLASRVPKAGQATISATTIGMHLRSLAAMYRWAINDGLLVCSNPADGVQVKSGEAQGKIAPTPEDADKLCNLPRPNSVGPIAWKYAPLILRYTGARWSECMGLTTADIITQNGVRCIHIRPGVRRLKTKQSERLVPVSDVLAPHIDELLQIVNGRLLPDGGDALNGDMLRLGITMNKRYNSRAKKVGPYSIQCWRVYANNQMASGGVDIIDRERILGHLSTKTQAAYTPADLQRFLAAVNCIA